ncbi:DUF3238 domain-containing protein [Paenibacillus sp. FSL M7-0420]|uniref:DUF3238 domain-containing protein n=1 Tax=Paenibacillus sp. FSL M7-0420 TaxID=2921609 RepID=UPI0030FCE02D
MANIVEVRTTAFIDDAWYLYGYGANGVTTLYFEGNNRGFNYFTLDDNSKFKMCHHIAVDFGANTVKVFKDVGPTRSKEVLSATGQVVKYTSGQTHSNDMSHSYTISATEANIYLRGAAANPLVNFAPDIDWEYNVKVKKDGTVTVTGKHDGFPCHEIWKRVDNATPVALHLFTKQTHYSLAPPMEINVNATA